MSFSPSQRRVNGTAMQLRFRRGETIDAGVQRILDDLTDEMVSLLDDPEAAGVDVTVHEVRRRCKHARALLRLIRPALRDEFRTIDRSYRDAGRLLASARDARIVVDVLDTLALDDAAITGGEGYVVIRSSLESRAVARAADLFTPHRGGAREARRLLIQGRAAAAALAVPDDPSSIADGAARTYAQARRAFLRLSGEGTPAVFHRWRIRVKQMRHQVALVEKCAPSVLGPLHESLYELSDALGTAHDLIIFSEHLTEGIEADHASERHRMIEVADRMRRGHQAHAIEVGSGPFTAEPEEFQRLLTTRWEAWKTAPC